MQMTQLHRSILFPPIFIALLFLGYSWWDHSGFVTYQEYTPTTPIAGYYVTDKRLNVVDRRHNHHKTLLLNLGPDINIIEDDNSPYGNAPPVCHSSPADCHVITTPEHSSLVISLLHPALNLPPSGMEVRTLKGRTLITLTIHAASFPSDRELSVFFDSMHPTSFTNIRTSVNSPQ